VAGQLSNGAAAASVYRRLLGAEAGGGPGPGVRAGPIRGPHPGPPHPQPAPAEGDRPRLGAVPVPGPLGVVLGRSPWPTTRQAPGEGPPLSSSTKAGTSLTWQRGLDFTSLWGSG